MTAKTQTIKENYELVLYRLDQIDKKLDTMSKNYVTVSEFDTKIDEFEYKLSVISNRNKLDKIMVTLFTSIIVSLSWYVLSSIIKGK